MRNTQPSVDQTLPYPTWKLNPLHRFNFLWMNSWVCKTWKLLYSMSYDLFFHTYISSQSVGQSQRAQYFYDQFSCKHDAWNKQRAPLSTCSIYTCDAATYCTFYQKLLYTLQKHTLNKNLKNNANMCYKKCFSECRKLDTVTVLRLIFNLFHIP